MLPSCCCRARFEREAAFVTDQNAKATDMVNLNIGGERFVTVPRSTLTDSAPDSMIAAMFSGRHKLRTDDNGRAYIDRSAKHFDYILDYLRNGGSLPAPSTADQELERVRAGTCLSGFVWIILRDLSPPYVLCKLAVVFTCDCLQAGGPFLSVIELG